MTNTRAIGLVTALLLVAGCALIDAFQEVEEPQCVWRDCACALDDTPCDPREACTPTTCRRCEGGEECEGTELCRTDREVCSSCDDQEPTEPTAICVGGECFYCEADSSDPNQYCVRDTCFF